MRTQFGAWRAVYTAGNWVALSGPTSLVLMPETPAAMSGLINEIWDEIIATDSITEVVRVLTLRGLDRLPHLGIMFWDDEAVHALVRGNVQVRDADTGEVLADGRGARTWFESQFSQARLIVAPDGVGLGDGLRLPMVIGAAQVSAIYLDAEARVIAPSQQVHAEALEAPVTEPVVAADERVEAVAEAPEHEEFVAAEVEPAEHPSAAVLPVVAAAGGAVAAAVAVVPTRTEFPVDEPREDEVEPLAAREESEVGRSDEAAEPIVERAWDNEASVTGDEAPAIVDAESVIDEEVPSEPESEPEARMEALAEENAALWAPAEEAPAAPADPEVFEIPEPVENPEVFEDPEPVQGARPMDYPEPVAELPDEMLERTEDDQLPESPQAVVDAIGGDPEPEAADISPEPETADITEEPTQLLPAGSFFDGEQGYGEKGYFDQQEVAVVDIPETTQVIANLPPYAPGQEPEADTEPITPEQSYAAAPQQFSGEAGGAWFVEPAPATREQTVRAPQRQPIRPSEVGDHDGATVYASGIAATHKPSPDERANNDYTLAALCPVGHPNQPGVNRCRLCGAGVDSHNPQLVKTPVLAVVDSDAGSLPLTSPVIVGRAPMDDSGTGAQLLRVLSPNHDVSRSHVKIAAQGWQIEVTDLYSTNGTTIIAPGSEPQRLDAGQTVTVGIGTLIDLGDGQLVTLRSPE